jgi:myo-inositol-1(or 4)-monophosphatase
MAEFIKPEVRENNELYQFAEFASRLSREAGKILLAQRAKQHTREYKTPTDFRIETDKIVDEFARKSIEVEYPDHGIMSEEDPVDKETKSGFKWYVDPLDGTTNFASSLDEFANSVGLERQGEVVAGAINAAARAELYEAYKGGGAYLNGKKINVGQTREINKAQIIMDMGKRDRQEAAGWMQRLLADDGIGYPRILGCTSVSICLVASGKFDAYIANVDPEDAVAGVIIAREAGAIVTNAAGEPWKIGDRSIVIANQTLHYQLLKFLQEKTAA